MNKDDPAFPFVLGDGTQMGDRYSTGMSLRQYAAIHLKVPDSGVDWLDEMIRKANQEKEPYSYNMLSCTCKQQATGLGITICPVHKR